MKYEGSCHCGNIKFEAEGEVESVLACNCSICLRKGTLLWFVPSAQFNLLSSPENITTYTFNKHHIKHQFCGVCGVQPFGQAKDSNGNETFAVNVRCLETIDPLAIPVQFYDGKSI